MESSGEKYVYKDGVRFEVTSGGLFYAPEESPSPKKHSCPDCRFCQWCADARCNLCRERTGSEPPEENKVFKMI
jgi:hypothetical protein